MRLPSSPARFQLVRQHLIALRLLREAASYLNTHGNRDAITLSKEIRVFLDPPS